MTDDLYFYDVGGKYPDRSDQSSHEDLSRLARTILTTCGPGRILDVGCGMGTLVQELLKQGADAHGVDVSIAAITHCNSFMPGRFYVASLLALPFPDNSFDTLISTGCFEHLDAEEIWPALREIHRVCRRNLFLGVTTEFDSRRQGNYIAQSRNWWEEAAFAAGFRKHPQYYQIIPFHTLEAEGIGISIPLEKIHPEVLTRYPLDTLMTHRDLHMDMSRETGRRSDAHMARYQLAATYVREGDTVLDAACGMGYGSHLLVWQSPAASVIGADLDREGIRYASENFLCDDGRLSFHVANAQQLDFVPDNSIDVFVSFETLEHVPRPELLIAEAKRTLRPGGRFIASVPNLWINEEGIDPNPHHLHVYDWTRLTGEIQSHFLIEAAYAQIAGGGMKLSNHPRSLREFSPCDPPPAEAEWWLVVGMKDPVVAKKTVYQETAFRWKGEPPNIGAFARDYENPWLIRSLISIGWRNRNSNQRIQLAQRVLAASGPGSPDAGAALCLLAYDLLQPPNRPTPVSVSKLSAKIDEYTAPLNVTPQCHRWKISLHYVRGLLWQAIGDLDKALESFKRCSETDALIYSPLLATKTIDACRLAGILVFQAGMYDDAKVFWTRGITLAERALKGDWREIHGDLEYPLSFGLREAAQVVDIASQCADNLHQLAVHVVGRGLSDNSSFSSKLQTSNRLLEESVHALATLRSSPGVRLQHAAQHDSRSVRRLARILYLLAVIFISPKFKKTLRPLAHLLRRHFTR